MSTPQINITVGTAGHIDHGKTALVKMLTGCDTDRLKEEKQRGMSIDLGHAPCKIAELEIGIVDVPGHENFVKTMVAGAAGMDACILVVAADDGVMPQTREHFDILTLLGVRHGMVALTKIDLVPPERVAEVTDQLHAFLRGTFLDGRSIVPMSNITGEGFGDFYTTLKEMVRGVTPKTTEGVFRVPVDRAFSVKGFGTVVAGIPVTGHAAVGDRVELLPQGQTGRLRGIQVYGRDSDLVQAGQCAALQVSHWDSGSIHRGCTVATPGYFEPRQWVLCSLRLLELDEVFLKNGSSVKFHTGTHEVNASAYLMESDRMLAGQSGLVQLRLDEPAVVGPADRYILRSLGPVRTIGGGYVVEGMDHRLKRSKTEIVDDARRRAEAVRDASAFVTYCVETAEAGVSTEALARRCKLLPGQLQSVLDDLASRGKVVRAGRNLVVDRATGEGLTASVLAAVDAHHREQPASPGVLATELAEHLETDRELFAWAIASLKDEGLLAERSGRLARVGHDATVAGPEADQMKQVEQLFLDAPFKPPSIEDVLADSPLDAAKTERYFSLLLERGTLVPVGELIFHRQAVEEAARRVTEHIETQGKLESVDFKYLIDTTRKFAIPLLDHLDRIGTTRRVGNTRYLRKRT